MNKLWKALFVITWLVLIFSIIGLSIFLVAKHNQSQTQQQVINQYISKGNGLSAYEVAVKNGFIGTEADWLISLNGKDSISKETTIQKETTVVEQQAVNGLNGKSSYEIWLDLGNVGTPQNYIDSLKGLDGKTVTTLLRYNETTGNFEIRLSTDVFWKVVPKCGGTTGKICN